MHKPQTAHVIILSTLTNKLQALSRVPANCRRALRDRWTAEKRASSNLDPLIRYDIGEIDCRPSPHRSVHSAQNSYLFSAEERLRRFMSDGVRMVGRDQGGHLRHGLGALNQERGTCGRPRMRKTRQG